MELRSDHMWMALDLLAEEHGLSPSGLAIVAGLDPTAFNRSKRERRNGRARWPSTETIAKVLLATRVSFPDFARLVERACKTRTVARKRSPAAKKKRQARAGARPATAAPSAARRGARL
jgi:phage repressor protein C with HTH and peptisase S24 domain